MGAVLLEVCVDDAEGLDAAVAGGADRIELCAALALGGLTPSIGLMKRAAEAPIPVFAMIRPRAGSFVFSETEVAIMEAEIDAARASGLAGVVLGANRADHSLDEATLARLLRRAEGLGHTLHRAFDLTPDKAAALEQAITLGFDRILTSGGALKAIDALPALAALEKQAAGRIRLMPGSGVTAANAAALLETGVRELHASCARPIGGEDPLLLDFGFASEAMRRTDCETVRALKAAISG
ncbi:copper homeostasis protein CutC [Rhizobium sp. YIM 134829]|uniref:copper homeostasis protein CutC n=1 Tax=Rhizobium sp. YIM 134829 TaxID=3390453 RepID=UPI00397C414B